MIFTIDRINAILRAEGMPRCQDFTRPMRAISREAQACGALERKYRMPGLDLEHLRFWMKGGQRVRMLLGERVNALEAHAELNPRYAPMPEVAPAQFETMRGEFIDMGSPNDLTISGALGPIIDDDGSFAAYFEGKE